MVLYFKIDFVYVYSMYIEHGRKFTNFIVLLSWGIQCFNDKRAKSLTFALYFYTKKMQIFTNVPII